MMEELAENQFIGYNKIYASNDKRFLVRKMKVGYKAIKSILFFY